jgi:hypothetical protein
MVASLVALLGCGRTELTEPGDEGEPWREDAGGGSVGADAGRDAGAADGGEVDAGEADGGDVDAGEVDGGEVDGGEVDGGEVDAGHGDAGAPDAGPRDAGAPACPVGMSETVQARLGVTADNNRAVWLNGVNVEQTANEWFTATTHVVPLWRHPSRENVIAVRATNLTSQGGLDRGLLLSLTLNLSVVATDARWRQRGVLDGGWPETNPAWLQPGFDDSAWGPSVEQAANGSPPWGFVNQVSANARWIWPYSSVTFFKGQYEPVLFRRSVYVMLDGGLADAPGACP